MTQASKSSTPDSQPGTVSATLDSRVKLIPWLYVIGVGVGELVTSFVNPKTGLLVHGLLFIILIIQTLLTFNHSIHKFYLSLSLAPIIRIISLSMPLYLLPRIYWYLLTGIPLLVASGVAAGILQYDIRAIGINLKKLLLQIPIGVIGFGLGYMEYLILHPQPLVENLSFNSLWLPSLILFFFTGFTEELIFRGIMQKASIETFGKWGGILLVSTVFAFLHIGHLSLMDVMFVFIVAMMFAELTDKTGSIIGVSLAHGITNITLYLVYPLIFGISR